MTPRTYQRLAVVSLLLLMIFYNIFCRTPEKMRENLWAGFVMIGWLLASIALAFVGFYKEEARLKAVQAEQVRGLWTTQRPQKAEYYWAVPKDRDDMLDGSPEVVKVYFDGKWSVIRPGYEKHFSFDDFELWSVDYIEVLPYEEE